MFRRLPLYVTAFTFVGLILSAMSASAATIYTFSTSQSAEPALNGSIGTITLTQVNSTSVNVKVDLIDTAVPNPAYGFVNTGGPHTPFAFTLAGAETGVSASFATPPTGFSLTLVDSDATPYGTFGIGINYSGGQGSGAAYYGDLEFQLTRTSGLTVDDFVRNGCIDTPVNCSAGYYFAADLTNGDGRGFGATGSVAWGTRNESGGTPTQLSTVPEPASMILLGSGLLGAIAAKRRRKASQI